MWLKKRFLRFLFVCLLACCMICLKNICSYAYNTNITEFENDIRGKFNLLKEKGVIGQSFNVNNLGTIYSGYDYVIFLRPNDLSNGKYLKIFTAVWNRNNHNSIVNNDYNNWGYGSTNVQVRGYNSENGNVTDSWWTPNLNSWSFDYAYTTIDVNTISLTLGEGKEYGQYFITTPPASISFNAYNDGNISVSYNGTIDSFLKFNISRSVPQWALGKLHGLSGDMRVDVKLNRYMNSEFTTLVGHAQWYGGQRTSSGGLSIATDGVVYIDNTMLYYNQGYYLTIDLEGENVDNYPLYFLPYASTATSGDLLSPLIDTNSDLEILQNLQELVNIQNIGTIYDENFDNSGELLGNLDYNDYHDNYYYAYFSDIFDELHTTLLSSGDRSISFGFMGTTINLNSSDFTVPNNALKVFCNTFLTFALFMYLYKSCFHMFHKLQEGNLIGAMHTMTVDDESVYM